MRYFKTIILFISTLLVFNSCDKGLEPPAAVSSAFLTGKVKFINDWPPQDSVLGVRVGAFKTLPSQNLIQEVIDGNALFDLNPLGYNLDSAEFQFEIDELPIELKYIVVAWQYETELTKQRVVGVYNIENDKTKPATINLNYGETKNIEIEVDWNEFPPQPF